jgi:hypothetical protein
MMVDHNHQPMFTDAEIGAWKPVAPSLMLDIGEFVSPIDSTLISSRSQLKEYEKTHGVVQVGHDLKSQTDKRMKEYNEWKAGEHEETGWCDPE